MTTTRLLAAVFLIGGTFSVAVAQNTPPSPAPAKTSANPEHERLKSDAENAYQNGEFPKAIELTSNTEAGALLHLAEPRDHLGKRRNRISHGLSVVLERVTQKLVAPPLPVHDAMAYLQKLEALGVRPTIAEPQLTTSHEADERVEKLLKRHGVEFGELLIGIHAGASKKKPRWEVDRFVRLAARMHHAFNARIVGNLVHQDWESITEGKDGREARAWVRACAGCQAECETLPSALYSGALLKEALRGG